MYARELANLSTTNNRALRPMQIPGTLWSIDSKLYFLHSSPWEALIDEYRLLLTMKERHAYFLDKHRDKMIRIQLWALTDVNAEPVLKGRGRSVRIVPIQTINGNQLDCLVSVKKSPLWWYTDLGLWLLKQDLAKLQPNKPSNNGYLKTHFISYQTCKEPWLKRLFKRRK